MMKRWRELREAVDQIARQLDQLDRRSEKMEVILMVREPTAGVAAEAYDGLRKQVVAAMTERMAHLQQLVQLDAALTAGADADGWASWCAASPTGLARPGDRHGASRPGHAVRAG